MRFGTEFTPKCEGGGNLKKILGIISLVVFLILLLIGGLGFKGRGKIWYSNGQTKDVEFNSWGEFTEEFGDFFDAFK